jgi:hypothetical protein
MKKKIKCKIKKNLSNNSNNMIRLDSHLFFVIVTFFFTFIKIQFKLTPS